MRIETVQLENIRSHVKSTVSFADGFNCLVGGLGSGKSSVLFAIDFVLLGDPIGRSYGYLLREGAATGKITLKFVHGERTYTITRALQRHDKRISQDMEQLKFFEGKKLIASTKNEAVAEQLKALTGLDKDLFREIVWVRQEHLKELLDVTPRQRQRRLDELFGLSDYEEAWNSLARFQRDYKVEKDVRERDEDVVGFKRLQTDYNRTVEDFISVKDEIENLEKKLIQAKSALEEAISHLKSLEESRKQTEELDKRQAELRTNLINIEDLCADLANQIEQRKSSIKDLKERLKSIDAQEKSYRERLSEIGLRSDQASEELREYGGTLENQMAILRGEQESNRREMASSERRVSNLKAESKCPFCLQTLSAGYKKSLLERFQKENIERESRQEELERNLEELERIRRVVNIVDSSLRMLSPRVEEVKKRLSSEYESLNKLSKEFGEKQQQEKKLREQLGATRAEIAKFDVTELNSARSFRDRAFSEHSETKHKLEAMEARKRDLSARMDGTKQRLEHAQRKRERVAKIEWLLEVIGGIRGAYRSIQPRLRSEFIIYLQRTVQQVLNGLVGATAPVLTINIDDTYTPIIRSEEGHEREASNISGGERTLLAFAYRIGLGQLIMQSRTGQGLFMLLLDEPTESLGREDGSVDRLAEAISRLKAIEQIIAVTHSEAFAEKAEHVIRVAKEVEVTRVSFDR